MDCFSADDSEDAGPEEEEERGGASQTKGVTF